MRAVARICFSHYLKQANVLFVIGGKANNTDIYETFRAIADALREHFVEHGPTPVFVVIGRGGPKLVRGMGAFADTMDALGLPYAVFGFDSAISEVVNYAQRVNTWMQEGGASSSPHTCDSSPKPEHRLERPSPTPHIACTKEQVMNNKGVAGFP